MVYFRVVPLELGIGDRLHFASQQMTHLPPDSVIGMFYFLGVDTDRTKNWPTSVSVSPERHRSVGIVELNNLHLAVVGYESRISQL